MKGRLTIALATVIALQIGSLAGFLVAQKTQTSPQLAIFDPQASLTSFVIWSEGRLEDGAFEAAIEVFQSRVEDAINLYAAQNSAIVLRSDALITQTSLPLTDITADIMKEVLVEHAF